MSVHKTVYKHRLYCQSESANVYTWSTSTPTTCPNNNTHTIDVNSITVVDSVCENDVYANNLKLLPFGEVGTAQKELLFELKSNYGKSTLRDQYTTTGSGVITNNIGDPEYTLTTSLASDTAILRSVQRGRIISGLGIEVGIAVRIPNAVTGNQKYQWGLYDSTDGMFFQLSITGLSVIIRRNSVDTEVLSSSFTGDASGIDYTRGNIFSIEASWYGYGAIVFKVHNPTALSNELPYTILHTYYPNGQTSVKNPILPISAGVLNNGTAASGTMFVAGRQYSILGKAIPIARLNSSYRVEYNVNSVTMFSPILAIRKKTSYQMVRVYLKNLQLISSANMIVHVITGGTLVGASYTSIPDQNSSESCIETDRSATAVSGGVIVYSTFVSADKTVFIDKEDVLNSISDTDATIITARALNVTNGNISCLLRWAEEW